MLDKEHDSATKTAVAVDFTFFVLNYNDNYLVTCA